MSDTPTGPPPGDDDGRPSTPPPGGDRPAGPPPSSTPSGPPSSGASGPPSGSSATGPPPSGSGASGPPPPSVPGAEGPPAGGPPASGAASAGGRKRGNRWLSGLLGLLLVGGSAFGLQASGLLDSLTGGGDDNEVVTEVLLEPRTSPGMDPFTMAVDDIEDVDPVPAPPPTDAQGADAVTVVIDGDNVGLYGGTNEQSSCDVEQVIAFLDQEPDKKAAWAQVQGLDTSEVSDYLRSLTPRILQVDTRVTNHGFRDGGPYSLQSVLQAGTAVLVDDEGVPRMRCACGNPLLAPAVTPRVQYTGPAWSGFDPMRTARAPGTPPPLPGTTPTSAATDPPASGGGPNLLTNGGFEAPMDPPWGTGIYEPRDDLFWGSADATMVRDVENPHSGEVALKIVNNSPAAPHVYRTVSQQVPATPGADHCLRFWTRVGNVDAGNPAYVTVSDAWTTRANVEAGMTDWTEVTLGFTAEVDHIDVRIVSENVATVWFDDLSLSEGAC